jgi:membrane protein required for colicin V production
LNWLDYLLIAVLVFSTVRSFRKGFTREIVGLIASLCALILGMWFYALAGSYVVPYVGSARVANFLGFIGVVVLVIVAGSILGWIVSRFLRTIGLSFFDRTLGAAFGLLRGTLIAIALLTAYIAFGPHAENNSAPDAVVHSRIAPYILEASHYFIAIAPMELKQTFGKQYTEFRSALEETVRQQRIAANQSGPKEAGKESGKK